MSAEELPAAETCVHNLYREVPGRAADGEATDLCRNDLGVFHMVDCPLTLGLPCSFYEAAAGPRDTLTDDDVVSTRNRLHEDFLGWQYRNRVRALSLPVGSLPERIELEAVPETEPEPGSDITYGEAEPAAEPVDEVPPVEEPARAEPRREERYPGQRRSEDKRSKARALRKPSTHEPPVDGSAEAEAPEEVLEESAAAVEEPEAEPERGPLTLDELFDALPEAPLPDPKPKGEDPGRKRRSGRSRGGRGRGPRSPRDPAKAATGARETGGGSKSPAGGEKPKSRRRRRPNKPHAGEKSQGAAPGSRRGSQGPPADGSRPPGAGGDGPRRRRRRRRPRGGSGEGGGGSAAPPSGD